MKKEIAIAGFILSLVWVLTFIFNFYSLVWFGVVCTVIGFILNLIVLFGRLEGKKWAIYGVSFNLLFVIIAFIMPRYLG